jgi:hypothetical protein
MALAQSAVRALLAGGLLIGVMACGPGEERSAEKPGLPEDVAGEGDRPPPATGTITGKLSFPSDYLPQDLEVCAEDVSSGAVTCASERMDDRYALTLPAGRYTVWAQTGDLPEIRAFYSHAVPCGLRAECADHAPIVIELAPGATLSEIDPGDWYAGS